MENETAEKGDAQGQQNEKEKIPSPSVSAQQDFFVPQFDYFCSHCGGLIDQYSSYCARCGTKIRPTSSSRIAKVFFIAGIIAIPIISIEGGFAIFLLNKRSSSPSYATIHSAAATVHSPLSKETDRSFVNQEATAKPKQSLVETAHAQQKSAAAGALAATSGEEKDDVEENKEEVEDTMPAEAVAALAKQTSVADNLKLARLYMGIGSYDDALTKFREVVKADLFNQEAILGILQVKKMKTAAPSPMPATATPPAPSAAPSRESTSTLNHL